MMTQGVIVGLWGRVVVVKSLVRSRKLLAFLSLLALVVVPLAALAAVYGAPTAINNPAPVANDQFGYAVSVDGNTFVVGVPLDDTGATDTGSAYLFDTTGTLLHTFNNPTPATQDHFGQSVSMKGSKVLIGAPVDDTGATDAGSAYLFDTTGTLLHTFNNPAPGSQDLFGDSVSLSDDKVLIGAHLDDTGGTNIGSAYLFDATTGALVHTFNHPVPFSSHDQFGASVSISDDKVLIGAPFNNTGASDAGSAYLFDATTGALLQTFNNPTPEFSEFFGHSVSLSGDKVVIGAYADNTGASDVGTAYIFDATTGALLQTLNNPTPESSDFFGYSVSLSGNQALIGAYSDNIGANDAGSTYLFDATTGNLLHTFNNFAPAIDDRFGHSVSLSGDNVLIGAFFDDAGAGEAGSAYLYLLQPDTDSDGISDVIDNCPANANANQSDIDGDNIGDVCDSTPNGDTDGDGVDELVDNCPADANPDQTDTDNDGEGDVCDFTPNGDTDGDGIDELVDNCPGVANSGQEDNDNDGLGNVCDPTPDGEPNPDPTTIDECKVLGWVDFGFRNQGQCVSFVNTGNDSR